jgi:hypothetical protein
MVGWVIIGGCVYKKVIIPQPTATTDYTSGLVYENMEGIPHPWV